MKIKNTFKGIFKETLDKLTEKELEKTKERMLAGMTYHYDNPNDAADIVLKWLGAGYSLADIKQFEDNINKVTLQQVLENMAMLNRIYPVWGELQPLAEGTNEN